MKTNQNQLILFYSVFEFSFHFYELAKHIARNMQLDFAAWLHVFVFFQLYNLYVTFTMRMTLFGKQFLCCS